MSEHDGLTFFLLIMAQCTLLKLKSDETPQISRISRTDSRSVMHAYDITMWSNFGVVPT